MGAVFDRVIGDKGQGGRQTKVQRFGKMTAEDAGGASQGGLDLLLFAHRRKVDGGVSKVGRDLGACDRNEIVLDAGIAKRAKRNGAFLEYGIVDPIASVIGHGFVIPLLSVYL